jgi:tetratricopeptide (TPR) repeat protein
MKPTIAQLLRDAAIARRAGRHEDALPFIEQALELDPKAVRLWVEKSETLRQLDRLLEARQAAHKATVLAPTSAEALAALGMAFLDLRKINDAERALERALQFDRRCVGALEGLGKVRLRQQRLEEAATLVSSALRISPSESRLYVLLGDIFEAKANWAGMVEAYRHARDVDATNTEALEKFVGAKQKVGGLDAAREVLEEAVGRMPDLAYARVLLGRFLSDHGMLEEAVVHLRRAVALDQEAFSAYHLLATSKKFRSSDDEDLLAIKAAYELTKPGTRSRALLAFSLAKAFDDIGDYEAAFDAYLEGNTISRPARKFSMDREKRDFGALEEVFAPDFLDRLRGDGHPSTAPIFIVGMPRSGTTLTETILSRHRDVHAAGELEFMKISATGVLGANPFDEARLFGERLKPKHLAEIGATYLDRLDAAARSAPRFTDKMPHNFRLVGLIRLVFPSAKIIHIRRDPVDNCLSMFKANFGADGLAFSFDLVELGTYYNLYRSLMRHWRRVMPGEFFEIDYEALVSNPEDTTRALFDYCELDWTPEVLDVQESRREVRTASFAQVRQPINKGSVSSGDRYGTKLDPLRRILAEWQGD